jgi:hypothetical protein
VIYTIAIVLEITSVTYFFKTCTIFLKENFWKIFQKSNVQLIAPYLNKEIMMSNSNCRLVWLKSLFNLWIRSWKGYTNKHKSLFFCLIFSKIYVSHSSIIQEWLVLTLETKERSLYYIYADCVLLFYENLFSWSVVIDNAKRASSPLRSKWKQTFNFNSKIFF